MGLTVNVGMQPVVPAVGGLMQSLAIRQRSPILVNKPVGAPGILTQSHAPSNPRLPDPLRFGWSMPSMGATDRKASAASPPRSIPTTPKSSPPQVLGQQPSPTSSEELWKQMEGGPFLSRIPSPVYSEKRTDRSDDASQCKDHHAVYAQRGYKRARMESKSPSPPEQSSHPVDNGLMPAPTLGLANPETLSKESATRWTIQPAYADSLPREERMTWTNRYGLNAAVPAENQSAPPRPRSNIHALLNSPPTASPQGGPSADRSGVYGANTDRAPRPAASSSGPSGYESREDAERMEWTPTSPCQTASRPHFLPTTASGHDGSTQRLQPTYPPSLPAFALPPPPGTSNTRLSFPSPRGPPHHPPSATVEEGEICASHDPWRPTVAEPYPGASRRRLPHLPATPRTPVIPRTTERHSPERPAIPPPARWGGVVDQYPGGTMLEPVRAPSRARSHDGSRMREGTDPLHSIAVTPPPSDEGFELPVLDDPEALLKGLSVIRAQALFNEGPLAAVLCRVYNVTRPDPNQARQIATAIETAIIAATGESEPQVVPPEPERRVPRELAKYPGTWVIRNIAPASVAKLLERRILSSDDVTIFMYPIEPQIPRYLFTLEGFGQIKPQDGGTALP
ncbi:hypothetical protein OH77DRAFT_1324595 [Trametes cingulata]|nr:hypothetical protein OH77DRAFT_1324595 [Trametes cingulata]